MKYSLEESKDLIDWLKNLQLGIKEAAQVTVYMEAGDTLGVALIKIYDKRKEMVNVIHENYGIPVIPVRV